MKEIRVEKLALLTVMAYHEGAYEWFLGCWIGVVLQLSSELSLYFIHISVCCLYHSEKKV